MLSYAAKHAVEVLQKTHPARQGVSFQVAVFQQAVDGVKTHIESGFRDAETGGAIGPPVHFGGFQLVAGFGRRGQTVNQQGFVNAPDLRAGAEQSQPADKILMQPVA